MILVHLHWWTTRCIDNYLGICCILHTLELIWNMLLGDIEKLMKEPHDIHWKDAKIILHYVEGTKHFRVHYVVVSPLELVGFIDSDWVGDSIDRNST